MLPKAPEIVFTMIGSGAVRVNPRRAGPAQLVRVGEELLLFDCGRGAVQNLARFGFRIEDISRIFITHLHFDHVCDLAQLILLSWVHGRRRTLRLYGPRGLHGFLETGVRGAYEQDIKSRFSHGKDPTGLDWEAAEIELEGAFLTQPDYTVSALFTQHGGLTNIHYRLDAAGSRRVVISSDTSPDERLVPFCEKADLLAVECSGTAEFLARREWGAWHMNPDTVAKLAREAEVKRAALKHLVIEDWSDDPEISAKMAARVREGFPGEVLVLDDGERVEIP